MMNLIIIIVALSGIIFILTKVIISQSKKNKILTKDLDSIKMNMIKLRTHNNDSKEFNRKKAVIKEKIKGAETDEDVKNVINDTLSMLAKL